MCGKKSETMPPKSEQISKREREEDEDGDLVEQKKRGPAQHWTREEILALERAKTKLALQNTDIILKEPGLKNRVHWQVNKRLRGDAKTIEKNNGGDPSWVDKFKVEGSKKGGQ